MGKTFKTYKEQAGHQNMSVARAKAIAIVAMLVGDITTGEKWYEYEDVITNIINSK